MTTPAQHPSEVFLAAMRRVLSELPQGVDRAFLHYFKEFADEPGRRAYLRHNRQLVEFMGGVQGRTVVDVGSGFGVAATLLSLWGARSVIAVDAFRPWLFSHRHLLATTFPGISNVHPLLGGAEALPLRAASADVILSNEAISHYADVEGFLDECARVLRPDGVVVVSDGNNGANPRIRAFTETLWERVENGPSGPFGEHVLGEPYVDRRERIIRERFPSLPLERARELALATSGMSGSRVQAAVESHLAGGPPPASHYRRGTPAIDPAHGQVMERLLDPRALARDFERRGFQTQAIPHYGGARGGLVLLANSALRRLPSFRFARGFRIVARRR